MSDLKSADVQEILRYIRKKTKKGPGYIWDFNDTTFQEFIEGCTGCNIDSDKYKSKGTSKEKRLRQFLILEENSRVILLLEELLDYGTRRNLLLKTYIPELNKIIKRLKKYEKTLQVKESAIKNKKEEEMLLKEIKEKISKYQYEFAIDRIHTLLKYKFEAIFKTMNKQVKGETLDSITGELNNILRTNEVFKEKTTFSILSATKKIMKDFDDARNNKTYAHANTIMEKNEAEFLCTYMIDYYNFISKIDFSKIKIV